MRCGRVTWICVTPIIRRTRCSDIRCKIDARLFRNAADLMLVVRRRQKSTRSRDRGVAGRVIATSCGAAQRGGAASLLLFLVTAPAITSSSRMFRHAALTSHGHIPYKTYPLKSHLDRIPPRPHIPSRIYLPDQSWSCRNQIYWPSATDASPSASIHVCTVWHSERHDAKTTTSSQLAQAVHSRAASQSDRGGVSPWRCSVSLRAHHPVICRPRDSSR